MHIQVVQDSKRRQIEKHEMNELNTHFLNLYKSTLNFRLIGFCKKGETNIETTYFLQIQNVNMYIGKDTYINPG
jgi:hypothetical protein